MTPCKIADCARPLHAKGLCALHYRRQRNGFPLTAPIQTHVQRHYDIEERFWSKVAKTSTCWLWGGSVRANGYGVFSFQARTMLAHRYAYELLSGPIPTGLVIDHLCRVRNCVNPAHLEAVTQSENVRRGFCPVVTRARHAASRKLANA